MDADLATTLVSLLTQQTQGSVQIAVMRKQNQMSKAALNMIDDATSKAPAPPGQGTRLDITV